MPGDTGFFQINNVVLNIPPEQIQIDRQSVNNRWQTLRTRSSIKSKSGYSVVNITVRASFTTNYGHDGSLPENGLQQLRAIIAGIRVTPFCYVENQFIRNSMIGGSPTPNMVLAVRQVQIIKTSETTNKIDVVFYFNWFNYFPYLREWLYKKEWFSSIPTTNPANSKPWIHTYEAELSRGGNLYADVFLDQGSAADAVLKVSQYATIKVRQYYELEQDVKILRDLIEDLPSVISSAGSSENTNSAVAKYIVKKRGAEAGAVLNERIFGETTSQMPPNEGMSAQQVIDLINGKIDGNAGTVFSLVDKRIWKAVINKKAKAIRLPGTLTGTRKDEDSIMLLERERELSFSEHELIINAVTISFENVLAVIPMAGQPYPTYQHIGSIDAVVSMSIMTTSEAGLATLSNFYSLVEDQATKFKQIPQGHRNIQVIDNMVNMCGLEYFIPESLTTSTIPGRPGTYSAVLSLVDNPLDVNTREKISPGQSFHTKADLRKAISDIIVSNLSLQDFSEPLSLGAVGSVLSVTPGVGALVNAVETIETTSKKYVYAPKNKVTSGKDKAFKDLCEEYAEHLTELYRDVLEAMNESIPPTIEEFYNLRSKEVPAIERIQSDIYPYIKSRKTPMTMLSEPPGPISFETVKNVLGVTPGVGALITTADTVEQIQDINRFKKVYLSEWLAFSTRFLDTILYSGKFFLPQFADVQKKVDEMAMGNNSGHSYPDFPLDLIARRLAADENPTYQNVIKELTEAASRNSFGLKNIGISALIQPDHYMYNAQNDDLGSIIPETAMNAAVKGLLQGQADARVTAEDSWLKEDYESKVLGNTLSDQIRKDATDSNFDSEFWGQDKDLQTIIRSVNDQTGGAFHFDDLRDEAGSIGLGCSILTEAENEPIPLKDIGLNAFSKDQKRSPGNLILKNRENASLHPNYEHHSKVRHFFGSESIAFQSKNSPYPLYKTLDPKKEPTWFWPTLPGCRRVKDRASPSRLHPIKNKYLPHHGADIVSSTPGHKTLGMPILAAADGNIINITREPSTSGAGAGNMITIQHSGGYITKYMHCLWEGEFAKASAKFWKNDTRNPFYVRAGEIIGRIGSTGGSTGAHLHWEMWDPKSSPQYIDGIAKLEEGGAKSQGPLVGFDALNESLFTKSVQQFEKDMSSGQGYSLMRAYPTFRLYFIESDIGERKRYQFDDFFSYNSIQDIQLIRNRKIAADLAIITLTNISGSLTNKKFKDGVDSDKPLTETGKKVEENPHNWAATNTTDENPIFSLMLKPGTQMQLRLGYNANPDDLERVINGVIVDVTQDETDDLITIVCQSFAIELVQNQHGDVKSFGGWFSGSGRTGNILEELIAYPEVTHFGRWEGGEAAQSSYGLLRSEWNFVPSPQDANIFAPGGRGIWGIFDSTPSYKLYQTTIWDVFQEMTLRHPAYIASPVPYEGKWGPRMTMFFGVPDQMYFARDPTFKEDTATTALEEAVKDAVDKLKDNAIDDVMDPNKSILDRAKALDVALGLKDSLEMKAKLFWLKKQIKKFALDQSIIRPFRRYHVLTSSQHIISNNITSSSNVYNTVTVQYGRTLLEKLQSVQDDMDLSDLKTFTLRCDAAVADEEVRELFAQYNNCKGFEMAKRYAVGLLLYSLKENYTGNIVIIGNPNIKPHDICYIFDEYSDMFGPIEVEQVVHRFSQRHGFVTEITPDMVVHVNQNSTLSTSDAMGLMAETALRRIGLRSLPSIQTATAPQQSSGDVVSKVAEAIPEPVSTGIGLAFDLAWSPIANIFFNTTENVSGGGVSDTPFGMIGAFIFRKLITRTQLAHPFRYSPLVKHGRPMVGGLPIKKNRGSFVAGINKWVKEADEGIGLLWEDTMDSMDPGNWFGKWQGDLVDTILQGRR